MSIEYLYFQSVARSPGADPAGGAAMDAVAAAVKDDGQPAESVWPYQKHQLYPPDWMPPDDLGELFHANADVGDLDVHQIVDQLHNGRGVVLGMVLTEGFRTPDDHGRIIFSPGDPERGAHAVLAVGYGHDQEGNLYVLIRNSWGTGWGLRGYAWISKAYLDEQLYETAVISKREQ